MPQPVTVSIALGMQNTEAGDNENDCPVNKKYEARPQLQAQMQAATQPSSSNVSAKTSHHDAVRLQMLPSVDPGGITSMGNTAPPSLNNDHRHVAKAAHAPVKRTKKIAKPKVKAKTKASSCTKKNPTKKKRGKNNQRGNSDVYPPPSVRLSSNRNDNAGGEASVTVSQFSKSTTPKDVHLQTPLGGNAKSKKVKSPSPASEPLRKHSKKPNVVKGEESHLPVSKKTKTKASSTEQGRADKSFQSDPRRDTKPKKSFPTTLADNAQLKKVVNIVVNMVADEIYYCASVFGFKRVNEDEDIGSKDLPNKKVSTETRLARKSAGGVHKYDFKCNNEDDMVLESSQFQHARNFPVVNQRDPFDTSHFVNISAEGDINLLKNDASSTRSSEDNISAKNGTHATSEILSQDEYSNSNVYDSRTVAIAVRRFVMEVYCPFLLSAKKTMGNNSPGADRVCISTLLAIREMLIMNGGKLFSFPFLGQQPSADQDRVQLSHVFANAIVRNTAKRFQLRHPDSCFAVDFIQATQNYDAKSEDFQFALSQADVQSTHTYFNGVSVDQVESAMAKVSFNHARSRHPLLDSKKLTVKEEGGQLGVVEIQSLRDCPIPTSCAAFQIEAVQDSNETEDDSEILESLRMALKRKRKEPRENCQM